MTLTALPDRLPTAADLHDLFNKGELGNLIARKFNGACGDRPGNQDSDFLVIFENEAAVPNGTELARVIMAHYCGLGYSVKDNLIDEQRFSAFFSVPGSKSPVEFVNITTRVLHENRLKAIRVTSTFVA